MSFLNIFLLGGMIAGAIPVFIHLFNRNRPKVIRWGAMHLLDAMLKSNARRLRIEQLLLLLLRVMIPLLLALCMAQPVIKGLKMLLGNAKTSLVLLLDNSYSMEAGGASQSNFAEARAAAANLINHLGDGSEIATVLMAGVPPSFSGEPTFDMSKALQQVGRLDAGYGAAAAAASLEEAAGIFSRMHHAHREVIIVSDFQKGNWSGSEATANRRSLDLLQKLSVPPTLTLFHVGKEVRDNVCVELLDYSKLVLGVGQKVRVCATLRNFGDVPYSDLRVYFRADGRERSVSQISLAPREQGQVLFSHAFDQPGSHVIEVVADADPLKADNTLLASIPVWDKVPVLLVNGDPRPEPLRGETDFIEIALRPLGLARMDLSDLIVTSVIDPLRLDAAGLAQNKVVVLANVTQLSDAQLKALEDFVKEGGGLLVFPGNRANASWYNSTFAAPGRGLLPAPLLSLAGSVTESHKTAGILAQHYDHPSLEMFNNPRNGNLADTQIRLWYKLAEEPSATRATEARISVLARLDNGDPFLIERKLGEGRIIECCTACDLDWSNLPLRPFYVPLTQQLVTYLASTVYPPRNVAPGQSLMAFLPPALAGKNAILVDPDGRRHELPIVGKGTRGVVEFKNAQRPGLYALEAPDGSLVHFVVNTSRKESDLQQLSDAELQQTAKTMGASLVRSWKDYLQLDQNRRFGREIWQPLLALVLLLCFAELLLQQYFTRRKL